MPDTDGIAPGHYEEQDLIRVILQALQERGYGESADTLKKESGVVLERPIVTRFKEYILHGQYDEALGILPEMLPPTTTDEEDTRRIYFLIERERYLELLEEHQLKEALHCLQSSLTPNASDSNEVHHLANLITICGDPTELSRRANWKGTGRTSREALLNELQQSLPRSLMVPQHRIDHLIQQAFKTQIAQCPIHFARNQSNLSSIDGVISDHQCDRHSSHFRLSLRLTEHADEVWFSAISHSGDYLVTTSRDNSAIVWSLPDGKVSHTLRDHAAGVVHAAWSPDDRFILTCSVDSRARLWDAVSGDCIRIFMLNNEASSGLWTSDGEAIIVASHDGSVTRFSRDGLAALRRSLRCIDMVNLSNDRIAALDNHGAVHVMRTNDLSTVCSFNVNSHSSACSLSTPPAQDCLLVSQLDPGVISLWEQKGEQFSCTSSYVDHVNQRYVIRPCLAREDQGIIATGSEDGQIYLYHRDSLNVVQRLSGHEAAVNCVSWTMHHGGLLVSVGDDKTVCLWSRQATNHHN